MAGGPILPSSWYPVNAGCFPDFTPNHQEEVAAVSGSIDGTSDVTWRFVFYIPETLPTGTPKIVLDSQANSTSQVIRIQVEWISVARTTAHGSAKSGEGQQNITLSGTANTPVETKIALDATTAPAASQRLEVDITFYGTNAAWTANVKVLNAVFLIWE